MTQQPIKPSPLGRGLSALFGDADASYQPRPAPAVSAGGGTRTLPLTWLQPGAFQPRRHFDEEMLKGLSESIREKGILEPLLVRPLPGGQDAYEIIAGERRWRAAQMAGLHDVPVLVRPMSDREALEIGLIENIQRQDLSPLEEAEGYQRLLGEFNHTQDALAKIIGKSRPHIANMLRLLTLPAGVKQMIDKGEITIGHARALITSKDPLALAKEIARKGLNVRQAEALAKRHAEGERPENFLKGKTAKSADTVALENEISKMLGLRVKLTSRGGGGELTLFYKSLDQLEDVVRRLKG